MVENPTVRLHALARGRAEEVKFGRWLRNPSVTTADLVEDCGRRLASQVAGLHVLAIQDTTELNYEHHAGRTRGLGIVGNGSDRGLFLHPMLAIDASGKRCLGLVGAEVWTRFECVEIPRRNRPIEDKESHRWLRGAERAKQVLQLAARVTVIGDRESDIYEAFAKLPGPNFDLLSRAAQDRKVAEGGCLFAYTSRLPVAGRIQFTVRPSPGKRQGRIAELEVRFGTVTLKRPHHIRKAQAPAQITLRVVDVRETTTVPPGEEPIHWRLLTNPCGSRSGEGYRDHRSVSSTLAYRAIVLDPQEPGLRSGSQSDRNRRSPDEVGDHGNTGCYSCHATRPRPRRQRPATRRRPVLH